MAISVCQNAVSTLKYRDTILCLRCFFHQLLTAGLIVLVQIGMNCNTIPYCPLLMINLASLRSVWSAERQLSVFLQDGC